MDASTFRTHFPEFASTTVFPSTMITFWSGIAERQLIVDRWADLYDHGIELCTAHYLAMAAADNKAAAAGGIGGSSGGVIASKSVGDVSVSYDSGAGIELDAGHWNLTRYGRQFIRLARMCGTGGYQL